LRNIAITTPEFNELIKAFNIAFVLPVEITDELLPLWEVHNFKRKQLITVCGNTERYLYFVVKGIQRCYAVHNDKEATIIFSYPYSFTGIIDSFFLQQPSGYDFEALTDSRLLRISYPDFMLIVDKYPVMEKWLRTMLTLVISGLLQRQKELNIYSAADKLNILFKRSPHIFNLVPHKYIASYIGVDPATFSKMMAKMMA
jgi:CRP-like cAMP-binding protein